MAQWKCGCGIYTLDPQDASLVLNGVPQCNMACLHRAEARAARDIPLGKSWAFPHRSLAEVDQTTRIIERTDGSFAVVP